MLTNLFGINEFQLLYYRSSHGQVKFYNNIANRLWGGQWHSQTNTKRMHLAEELVPII